MRTSTPFHPAKQLLVPSPKRHLQTLIATLGLKTGLDIGCNVQSPLTPLRGLNGFQSTGLDAYAPAIETARCLNLHDEYICADARDLGVGLKFDVVVASHIIEHLKREDGFELLLKMESLATRIVYVETPYGFLQQDARDGNSFQRHLSGWFPHDFMSRGYAVFGMGLRVLRGPEGKARLLSDPFARLIERSFQWYTFENPGWSHNISGIRYMDGGGNLKDCRGLSARRFNLGPPGRLT
jgi:hypothetical protein